MIHDEHCSHALHLLFFCSHWVIVASVSVRMQVCFH